MLSNSLIRHGFLQRESGSIQFGMTQKPTSPDRQPQSPDKNPPQGDRFSRQPSSPDADQQEISTLTAQKERLEQQCEGLSREIKSIESKFKQATASNASVIEELTCAMREKCRLDKQIEQLHQAIQLKEETRRFNAELNALKESSTLDQFNGVNRSQSSSRADRLLQTALKFDNPEAIENLHQKGYFEADRKTEEAAYRSLRQSFPKRTLPPMVFDTTKIGPEILLQVVEQDAEKCFARMLELGAALSDPLYTSLHVGGQNKYFQNIAMFLKEKAQQLPTLSFPFTDEFELAFRDGLNENTQATGADTRENLYQKYLDRLPQ